MKFLKKIWLHGWLKVSVTPGLRRLSYFLASLAVPPHKAGTYVASISRNGYITPTATIHHSKLTMGKNVFIGDRAVLYENTDGEVIDLDDKVHIHRDSIIETGFGGSVKIGRESCIHPRCQINGYVSDIIIGEGVWIAPNCALYSYDHGIAPGIPIRNQPLETKGDIIIEDEAWLGFGSIILSGVTIGKGSIVAAGSVVIKNVPPDAVVAGVPAKVISYRDGRQVNKGPL